MSGRAVPGQTPGVFVADARQRSIAPGWSKVVTAVRDYRRIPRDPFSWAVDRVDLEPGSAWMHREVRQPGSCRRDRAMRATRQPEHSSGAERQNAYLGHHVTVAVNDVYEDVE